MRSRTSSARDAFRFLLHSTHTSTSLHSGHATKLYVGCHPEEGPSRNIWLRGATEGPPTDWTGHNTKIYGGCLPFLILCAQERAVRGTHLGLMLNPHLYQSAPMPRYQTVRGCHPKKDLVETFGEGWATEEPPPDWTGHNTKLYGGCHPEEGSKKVESRSFLMMWGMAAWLLLTCCVCIPVTDLILPGLVA